MRLYVNKLLFYCPWLSTFIVAVVSNTKEGLHQQIFTNYNSSFPPVKNHNTVVNVTMNIQLMQLHAVDEKAQTLKMICYYEMYWTNQHLSIYQGSILEWNSDKWSNVDSLNVRATDVWIPDILLTNSVDAYDIHKNSDAVYIEYTGYNQWYTNVSFTVDTE